MLKKHDAGTNQGRPIVATRNTRNIGCGQVFKENRWNVCLFVNREEERKEVERGKSNDKAHRREQIVESQTKRPLREFVYSRG